MTDAAKSQEWVERIERLLEGESAPEGYRIVRVLGTVQQPVGTGTNFQTVYIVAVRRGH